MKFYVLLAVINVFCFLPLYALNIRRQTNPFLFLSGQAHNKKKLKFLYTKPPFTDPFRVNFDFTFVALLSAATGVAPAAMAGVLALLLTFGFVEIGYTATLHLIFQRPPAVRSDLALAKSGLDIAQGASVQIIAIVVALLAGISLASYGMASMLLAALPQGQVLPAILAAGLVLPAFYHAFHYPYGHFYFRTVYSPTLHLWRNLAFERQRLAIPMPDSSTIESCNQLRGIELRTPPNIVILCIESYGSIAHKDPRFNAGISGLIAGHELSLADRGLRFASAYSNAPIFAGGSWLSYTTFTYGVHIDDLILIDRLFGDDSPFLSYESLFHVLKRNHYRNYLLCPLGGIAGETVDWTSVERCFQADERFEFDQIDYRGPRIDFFGHTRAFGAPDQYSLNFAYDKALRARQTPFSLFFCTLNSHYPWASPRHAVADWRAVNRPDYQLAVANSRRGMAERYLDAIHYQLDFTLQFVGDRAADDPLIIIFGDHQPPLLTPEGLGKSTPVHVIGSNPALIDSLLDSGFVPSLGLGARSPITIEHAGFLSLFMQAMNRAYGCNPDLELRYRPRGAPLFDETELVTSGA